MQTRVPEMWDLLDFDIRIGCDSRVLRLKSGNKVAVIEDRHSPRHRLVAFRAQLPGLLHPMRAVCERLVVGLLWQSSIINCNFADDSLWVGYVSTSTASTPVKSSQHSSFVHKVE